jgi:hypothetical protein
MNRNKYQFGGNIEQLRKKIDDLSKQREEEVFVVSEETTKQIAEAKTKINELNEISQQTKEELAKQRIKINQMLALLKKANLGKFKKTDYSITDMPEKTETNDFIQELERFNVVLDTYNLDSDINKINTYIGSLDLSKIEETKKDEFLDFLVESLLTVVSETEKEGIKTILTTKFNANNVSDKIVAVEAKLAAEALVDADTGTGTTNKYTTNMKGGNNIIKLNLKNLI